MNHDDVLAKLSADRAWRDVEWLSREVPEHLSGSPEEERAAQYLADQLTAAGIATTIHRLPGLVSFPDKCTLEITGSATPIDPIVGMTFAQSGSTPPEGVEGELVYVGPGGEQDYEGKDVTGKIVLASLSYAPPRPEKTRIAMTHGALALVVVNWGPPDNPSIPMGTVKAVWGNPTPDTLPMMPSLPAAGISRLHGEQLQAMLKKGAVRVRLHARATREWRTILLPEGRIEAAGPERETFVMLGGHFDAWGGGTTDNATGNAAVLEVARILADHRSELRRSVRIVFWPGHENGIMEGSTWFVDRFWDEIDQNAVLYLNVDSPAMKGTTRWYVWSSPETRRWHQSVEQRVAPSIETDWHKLPKIGDQSFFGVGVPAMFALNQFEPEQVAEWGGAIFAPWYQSTDDTIDKADPERLADAIRYYAAYMLDLCSRPVLPFEFVNVADVFITRLDELAAAGVPDDFNLGRLHDLAVTLRKRASELDHTAERINGAAAHQQDTDDTIGAINAAMMDLSRTLTHALATVTGRYDQDSYGLSALEKALPGLHDAEVLATLEADSDEYRLLWTRAIRQRNRVADALRDSIAIIDRALERAE
jgi:hypothetical protein